MIFFIYVYVIVLISPLLSRYYYTWYNVPNINKTVAIMTEYEFFHEYKFIIEPYGSYFTNTAFTTVPVLVILFCSVGTVLEMALKTSKKTIQSV